jgi:signal transduction histidine kinase
MEGVRFWLRSPHAGRGAWRSLARAIRGRHTTPPSTETLDGNLTALVRLVLGLMTLLVAAVELREDIQPDPVIVAVIVAYIAYASVAYVLVLRRRSMAATHALNYRVDAVTFVLLISITSGTDDAISNFAILLFLFAAMTASLAWGVGAGLGLTLITAGLFSVAMLGRAGMPNFEGSHAFLHLSYILGLGVVAARWSGHHFTLHRRLALLRDAGALSNPRFGVDRTITTLLERLQEFYDADVCLLVSKSAEEGRWRVRRCARDRSTGAVHEEVLPAELEDGLLWVPQNAVAVYVRPPFRWWLVPARLWSEALRKDGRSSDDQMSYHPAAIESLLTRFGGRSWLSVPVYSGQHWHGRLHLTAGQALRASDARFVAQVIGNSMLVIENIRLLDQLASSAAHRERLRLARDIHDSVIQPFIGMQLGLVAVQRALGSGDSFTAQDEVSRLLSLTSVTINDLRAGVGGLKAETDLGGDGLLPALRRYAARFAEDTGITVEVSCEEAIRLGDRLGAELFQVAVEALSNVRRHTAATRAAIRFLADKDHVTLQVENQEPSDGRPTSFTPRSIHERASALGGHVSVDRRRDGRTIVEIRIPL